MREDRLIGSTRKFIIEDEAFFLNLEFTVLDFFLNYCKGFGSFVFGYIYLRDWGWCWK